MRSYSVTVTLTPRQAVTAGRALEHYGAVTEDQRAYPALSRVHVGLTDAGWEWDEWDECWRFGTASVKDRAE